MRFALGLKNHIAADAVLPETGFTTHGSESPRDVRPWKVEGPGEAAEAPPAVAQKLRPESAARAAPLAAASGWTSQERAPVPQDAGLPFWPDGALLGGGPRRPLS